MRLGKGREGGVFVCVCVGGGGGGGCGRGLGGGVWVGDKLTTLITKR